MLPEKPLGPQWPVCVQEETQHSRANPKSQADNMLSSALSGLHPDFFPQKMHKEGLGIH